ncbi:MAG: N-acetylglucosamine/diacetylchitobiose ABC transporter substrate-binding protein [Thermomicrobiales bacterium]
MREVHDRIDQLFREVAASGMSRRQMIQRAAVLGISPLALSVAVTQVAGAQGAENPLGVDPEAPLDVVIFKGGYGDDYAVKNNERFSGIYPNVKITYAGTQRLQEQYQARFVDGNPPDVMDNSGAGNFSNTTLVNEGQLTDLAPLMAAEAFGQTGVTFADSLGPGTQDDGVYNGKQFVLNYVYNMWGIWHNKALFDEKGWEYPTTWDAFFELAPTIKDAGIAPLTYQGLYPTYMQAIFNDTLFKAGGPEAMLKLDNLAEDAWTQPLVAEVLTIFKRLYDEGWIMEGTEALSHTESQAAWLEGKAAFIPCGTWLENEMKDVIPEGFQMVINASPGLGESDALPQTAGNISAGETFIVPAGKNPAGGMEWLRLLFSKEGGKTFSELTKSLTVVTGSADGLDLGTAFKSAQDGIAAAGPNTWSARYSGWYEDLADECKNQFGLILTGQTSVEDMVSTLQDLTDQIREDDSIPKFTREAPTASPEASPAA